jgi:hypothetical protein
MAVNYLAILVASIVSMAIGFLWYGPLFGKLWMSWMNLNKKKIDESKQKGMAKYYVAAFIGTFVTNLVLAGTLTYIGARDVLDGVALAFWLWLGFIATTTLSSVLWEGKPVKLYLLNNAHNLVSIIVAAIILVLWP